MVGQIHQSKTKLVVLEKLQSCWSSAMMVSRIYFLRLVIFFEFSTDCYVKVLTHHWVSQCLIWTICCTLMT